MVNSTRICKICGKEYPYCKTVLKDGEIFRWQDVACCEEHGSEYFAQIFASRNGDAPALSKPEVTVPIAPVIDDDIDDEEEDEEEDNADNDEDEE